MLTSTSTMKIRKNVLAMRESVSTVVTLLSRQKVPVTLHGDSAYVQNDINGNPVGVNLPAIPDDASDDYLMAIRGFLDHEVAHILFTDFKTRNTVPQPLESIWNIIEDIYIERKMSEHLKGCGFNLGKTRQFVLNKSFDAHYEKALESPKHLDDPKRFFIEILFMPSMRALCGQPEMMDWMRINNKWQHIKPIVNKINAAKLPQIINEIGHTSDSIEAATILAKLLISDEKETPPLNNEDDSEKSDEKGDGGKGDTSDDQENSDQGSDYGDSEQNSLTGDQDKVPDNLDNGDDDDNAQLSCDDNVNDGDDNNDDINNTDDDNNDDINNSETEDKDTLPDDSDVDTDASNDRSDHKDAEQESNSIPEFSELDDYAEPTSIEDALSEIMSADRTADSYFPLSQDLDWMGCVSDYPQATYDILTKTKNMPFESAARNKDRLEISYKRGAEYFDHYVKPLINKSSALNKEIERLILGQNKVQWRGGKRSGQVNGSSLFKLKTGDNRVFRTKEIHTSKNAAVLIVNDLSGSMSCAEKGRPPRHHQALACSYMLADALEKCRIPTMVTGFTTLSNDSTAAIEARLRERGEVTDEMIRIATCESMGRPFRVEPLVHPIMKDWDTSTKTAKVVKNIGFCASGSLSLQNNVDGESLLAMLPLLLSRPEEVKLMIVLSDGEPYAIGHDHVRHLLSVSDYIQRQTDIHLVGIGIETDTSRFYKNACRIDDINDLPKAVCDEIRKTIIA